jgi:hypothetical protein
MMRKATGVNLVTPVGSPPNRAAFTRLLGAFLLLSSCGCRSPEDGRPRGGGRGADGGNYQHKPIHVPSKIDGTKPIPAIRP